MVEAIVAPEYPGIAVTQAITGLAFSVYLAGKSPVSADRNRIMGETNPK